MTGEQLERMLTDDGWPFEKLDDHTWRSGFKSEGQEPFRMFVRTTSNWLVLTIVPFVTAPADDADALALFRRMLELNREITLAKLALDKRDVILTVELPLEGLQASQLKDGLDAMVFYANSHHAELSSLAKLGA
jgi:hypothetical protein